MKLLNCSPVLFVSDIRKSLGFYCDLLGMKVKLDLGKNVIFDNNIALWEVRPDHIVSSVYKKNTSLNSNTTELYFECSNIDEAELLLRKSDVRFLHTKHEEPWGQETIRFFDPDGHLIEIGETMPVFLEKFRAGGMSIDQISARTSVPREDILRMLGEDGK